MNSTHRNVLDILQHTTEERPISLRALTINLNVCNDQRISSRTVKALVQELRRHHGIGIGTSRTPGRSGYWLINCPKELREMAGKVIHEGTERIATGRAMEATADAMERNGQGELFDVD